MSARGGNVTVTIGAAFAGSFKSVLREPSATPEVTKEQALARFRVIEGG